MAEKLIYEDSITFGFFKENENVIRAILAYENKDHKDLSLDELYKKYIGGDRYEKWSIERLLKLDYDVYFVVISVRFPEGIFAGHGHKYVFRLSDDGKIIQTFKTSSWVS